MKRILLAISIGFVLVIVYTGVTAFIFIYYNYDAALLPYLDFPVRLPKTIFFYFYPPTAQDYSMRLTPRKTMLGVFSIIFNSLLCAMPTYLLLRFFSGRRRKKQAQITMPPPPPPSF